MIQLGPFRQVPAPAGGLALSALVALLPLITILGWRAPR